MCWLSGSVESQRGAATILWNEAELEIRRPAISDNVSTSGAALVPYATVHGVALRASTPSSSTSVAYKTISSPNWWAGLAGCTQLTMMMWFMFQSTADGTGQRTNFRLDDSHTLDIFSVTSSSITWGADWAGAWNGASQQTLSGLTDGQFVCIGASINSSGARFFANGVLSGTKSGNSFTTGIASVTTIIGGQNFPTLGRAAFRRALSDAQMIQYTSNPWDLWDRPAMPLFGPAAAATYTMTSATYVPGSLTSSSVTPRIVRTKA